MLNGATGGAPPPAAASAAGLRGAAAAARGGDEEADEDEDDGAAAAAAAAASLSDIVSGISEFVDATVSHEGAEVRVRSEYDSVSRQESVSGSLHPSPRERVVTATHAPPSSSSNRTVVCDGSQAALASQPRGAVADAQDEGINTLT